MLKDIDLTNKCGSCDHFRRIDGTAQGECLKNPYGENVVHDPKYPYWIVTRSRAKCRWYTPQTNADRIRAMSDEELARDLAYHEYTVAKAVFESFGVDITKLGYDIEAVVQELLEQLQQPCGVDMRGEEDG